MSGEASKISVFLEPELHKRLKITAYQQDTTIQSYTEKAIRTALANPNEVPSTTDRPMTKKEIRHWATKLAGILETGNQ